MIDIWTRARQAAVLLRQHLLGTDSDRAPAGAAITSALASAGLETHTLPPGDTLLAGAHAVLVRDMDAIWIRQDLPSTAQSVLIAHELAHFHLHPEYTESEEYEGAVDEESREGATLVGYGPRERRETEANAFAREFVLPAHLAHRFFYDENRTALEISQIFGVSTFVVFKQLQSTPIMTAPSDLHEPVSDLSLDDSQREAAYVEQGPMLLGAGPGTGKTRTLVARVKYLWETGVAPENILCLTFSRKATNELRERIAQYLPEAIARRVAVSTFHAFGLDLLRRYHHPADLPPNPLLVSLAEAFALMENRIAGDVGEALWFPHDPTYPLRDCLQIIGRLKEEMVTPEEAAERARTSGDSKQIAVAAIYARYEQILREKQALDSADLVCRTVTLLAGNEMVREREQSRWKHILVDEYQDVNRAGARLVQLLGGDGAGVWCVGDLRQAIYRFRGASPANVTRFTTDFPGGKRHDLAVNYRSRPRLVSFFGQIAESRSSLWNAQRDPGNSDPRITLATADDENAQVFGIVHEIHRLRAQNPDYRWQDFAILCRTNPQARALRTALHANQIPVRREGEGISWLRDKGVRELLLLISLASNGTDSLAHRTGHVLPEYLVNKDTPIDFLNAALYGPLGLARTYRDNPQIETLLILARTFGEQSDLLRNEDEPANVAFLRHIRRVARLQQEPKRSEIEDNVTNSDVVSVLTIHSAKGLEFPVIFVPNLSQGRFPPQARPATIGDTEVDVLLGTASADADEESRLFFVAISRARDYLVLSLAEKYDGRSAQPSSLIASVTSNPDVRHVRWTTSPGEPIPVSVSMESPGHNPPTTPTPAYELEQYLRCPRQYYYEVRCGYGDLRERTAYDALKKAFRMVLRGKESETAFREAWEEYALPIDTPWKEAYRREWETVLANAPKPATSATESFTPTAPHHFALAGNLIEVRPDRVAPDGAMERFSFAKSKETGRQDATNTLLFSALPEGTTVRVRHVRTGEERIIEPAKHHSTRRAREVHLAHYERAMRGIRLNVFPATPEDPTDCADCAYLLICDPGDC